MTSFKSFDFCDAKNDDKRELVRVTGNEINAESATIRPRRRDGAASAGGVMSGCDSGKGRARHPGENE